MKYVFSCSLVRLIVDFTISLQTRVVTWGNNSRGQLGSGDTCQRKTPVTVSALDGLGVIKVVTGNAHTIALTSDAQVWVWGDNFKGELQDQVYVY
jgi:alpha-tubulin suppressor-like RCC1 family protein